MSTMRSRCDASPSSAASRVVLPAPPAPVTSRLRRAATASRSSASCPSSNMPARASAASGNPAARGTRTEMSVPAEETGGRTACTRMPRPSRTSTAGVASSMCRPPRATSCTARARTSASSADQDGSRSAPAPRSIQSPCGAVDEEVGDRSGCRERRQRPERAERAERRRRGCRPGDDAGLDRRDVRRPAGRPPPARRPGSTTATPAPAPRVDGSGAGSGVVEAAATEPRPVPRRARTTRAPTTGWRRRGWTCDDGRRHRRAHRGRQGPQLERASPTPLWRRTRPACATGAAPFNQKGAAPIGGNRCRLGSARIGGNHKRCRPRNECSGGSHCTG